MQILSNVDDGYFVLDRYCILGMQGMYSQIFFFKEAENANSLCLNWQY